MTQQPISVLIVDDEPDIRLLVRATLAMVGLEIVEEACDGPDALDRWARLDPPDVPHVVVLDNRMPGMTGLDVARAMLARFPDQRIVLFSAFMDDTLRRQAYDAGIAGCVSKEDLSSLASVVERVSD